MYMYIKSGREETPCSRITQLTRTSRANSASLFEFLKQAYPKMTIDFYYMPVSGPCRAIIMTAKILDIPLNLKYLDLMKKEQLAPEFVKLNPQHCVPTIDDNGFVLWESRAITAYLVNKYSPGHELYPSDPEVRAAIDRFLYFDIGTLGTAQRDFVYPQIFGGTELDPEKEKVYQEKLALLDSLLADKKYLVGENVTLADLHVVSTLSFLEVLDYSLSSHENITEWMDRLKAEVSDYEEINGEPLKQFKEWREAHQKSE